jgi:tetratricopeptide (TPR) repeat protein
LSASENDSNKEIRETNPMRANQIMQSGIGIALAASICLGQAPAPTAAQTQRQAAITLEQQGRNPEAETTWKAVLQAHPSSPEALAHLGLLEARQEHYTEAVAFYRKALALNPAIPSLKLNLGLALFKSGQMKEAIAVFQPLLKSQPAHSPEVQRLTILLGMAHYGLFEYGAAVPYLKSAAAADAQNLQLRLALAHSCLWSKQYQCVLDTYHEILTLNAESAEADMLAGEALDELKNSPDAIKQFRAAVKANPKEPEVHFGLGYLLWTIKQYPEAVEEFKAELANNPDHAQALTYLADTEMQLNKADQALPLLEHAKRVAGNLSLARLDLGILYADAGRNDEALIEMREAARLTPEDSYVHYHLGRLLRTMGKKEEAQVELARAASIHKASDDALKDKMTPIAGPSKPVTP